MEADKRSLNNDCPHLLRKIHKPFRKCTSCRSRNLCRPWKSMRKCILCKRIWHRRCAPVADQGPNAVRQNAEKDPMSARPKKCVSPDERLPSRFPWGGWDRVGFVSSNVLCASIRPERRQNVHTPSVESRRLSMPTAANIWDETEPPLFFPDYSFSYSLVVDSTSTTEYFTPTEIFQSDGDADGSDSSSVPSSQFFTPLAMTPTASLASFSTGGENQTRVEQATGLQEFELKRMLGQGAFGKVVLGLHKATKSYVAIKTMAKAHVIDRHMVRLLYREKQIFQAVSGDRHPFCVNLFACLQTDDEVCFVMDYAAGGDLRSLINKKRITDAGVLFYTACVVLGVQHLHNNNIVHRDLKPENIVMDHKGYVRITDFGLGKLALGHGEKTKTLCGTPQYYAPEMMLEGAYSRSVDWWAVGVCMYEMVVGYPPYKGKNKILLFTNIINDEVKYPSESITAEQTTILQRLLCKEPDFRLGSNQKGAEEVKEHPYFNGMDWRKLLEKEIAPPFIPTVSFEEDNTISQTPNDNPTHLRVLNEAEKRRFEDF